MARDLVRSSLKTWLVRLLALQFGVTATTGLLLYARPLDDRAGLYGKPVKEWLVMIHNGEWIGHLLFGQRWLSGLLIGAALALPLWRHARRGLIARADAGSPTTLDAP